MKRTYRISPDARPVPTDEEIARYRDPKQLLYNYQKASRMLHARPLYRDPKAFVAIVLIVLLAWFIAEVVNKEEAPPVPPREQQQGR